jgi:hypothetical protein
LSLARQLPFLVVVALPVAAAVLVSLLDLWPPLAPLLLVAGGLGYVVLAARFATELAARQAVDTSQGATKTESAERFLADKPFAALMPFLFVGGFPVILIGLVWLALVDLVIFAVVLAALIVASLWWKRRAPGRPATPTAP